MSQTNGKKKIVPSLWNDKSVCLRKRWQENKDPLRRWKSLKHELQNIRKVKYDKEMERTNTELLKWKECCLTKRWEENRLYEEVKESEI